MKIDVSCIDHNSAALTRDALDGDCIAMGGDSLFDFLPPDAQYFPNGWKCGRCPLIDLTDDGK